MPRLLLASFSVCPAPDRHGAQLANLIKALAPRFELDVVTLRVGELPYVDRFQGARMLRVPVGAGDLPSQAQMYARALGRQLEGEDYDLVHLRSAWGARQVIERASPATRIIYDAARSLEGEPAPADDVARQALALDEAACLEHAHLVLVPTETARRHLERRGLGGRAMVVPPGVDIDEFDWEPAFEERASWLPDREGSAATPMPPTGSAARGRVPPRILYAGRMAAGSGVRLLVGAVGLLRSAYDVRLYLAGPVASEFVETLDGAIDAADIRDVTSLLGAIRHSDIPRVVAQADVCVAPAAPNLESRPLAGCPIKVLEYLACRRAVVAPRRPAIVEVLRDGRDGLLFAADDVADLATQIARLLANRELRLSLAESGYRRVRSRFPASATRRALLVAYARLAPPNTWTPPAHVVAPIGAMPAPLDSTTARFQRFDLSDALPGDGTQVDARAQPETPLPIFVDDAPELPDFVAAGPLLGGGVARGPVDDEDTPA